MKIAIDFDGVICQRKGIPTIHNWNNAEPMEGALDAIVLLLRMKYEIWIFTSNPEPKKVKEWLDKHGFPLLEVTNIKKPAHVYIDDRAIRFTNWQDMRKYFV
jgi:5'(3')-deoxyribonucleotidase